MKDLESNTRFRLLEAGKKEFLEHGYEKASLRRICSAADVTTGALYFFFKNKADLFEQIVRGALDNLGRLSQDMIESELEDPAAGVENEKRFLEFCWTNREIMLILSDKSDGTPYEGFMDEVRERLEETYAQFFQRYTDLPADKDLMHILVRMKVQAYLDLIKGGHTLERTRELAELLGVYADGGFERLVEYLNNNRTSDRM